MYLKTLLSLALSIILWQKSFCQKDTKFLISANYRLSAEALARYYPVSLKLGVQVLESRYVRFIPYVNGEMNLKGLSALAVGYSLTAFQNENSGSTYLILDVRGIERFKNYSDRIQNQYGSVAKAGFGYSIGRMKYLEGGLTLEDGRYLGMELGYSQIVSIPKRNRTPKRFAKAKNMVKCP